MPAGPRAVIGAPLYDKALYLPTALDSLLAQTFGSFAVILVDDCSSDETAAIARAYADADPRVTYIRNDTRLGMVGNKRRCFELAATRFPDAPYFAWGSDHDVWRPRWLEALAGALDERPSAVLAYPLSVRIDEDGNIVRLPWTFETYGVRSVRRRVVMTAAGAGAGSMVYGLYRADALRRAGVLRYVLNPDRLLHTELALHGEFVQIPEVLWEKRFVGIASRSRQRRAFFPDGAPLRSRAAPWLAHVAIFFWRYAVRGEGRPATGRIRAAFLALELLRATAVYQARRRLRRIRKALGRRLRRRV